MCAKAPNTEAHIHGFMEAGDEQFSIIQKNTNRLPVAWDNLFRRCSYTNGVSELSNESSNSSGAYANVIEHISNEWQFVVVFFQVSRPSAIKLWFSLQG